MQEAAAEVALAAAVPVAAAAVVVTLGVAAVMTIPQRTRMNSSLSKDGRTVWQQILNLDTKYSLNKSSE